MAALQRRFARRQPKKFPFAVKAVRDNTFGMEIALCMGGTFDEFTAYIKKNYEGTVIKENVAIARTFYLDNAHRGVSAIVVWIPKPSQGDNTLKAICHEAVHVASFQLFQRIGHTIGQDSNSFDEVLAYLTEFYFFQILKTVQWYVKRYGI